jgi:hypothetical protein
VYFEAQVGKRTSTDSIFEFHKEKEMNFRRMILAMAMLALFVGLASAQVITGPSTNTPAGSLRCSASVAVPNQLRSEGMTELIGDIILTCTGGNPLPTLSVIPTANITVSLATNVTSRLLGCTGFPGGTGVCSEATLLVDEPNTNTTGGAPAGLGPAAGFTSCLAPQGAGPGGCVQYVSSGVSGPPIGQSASGCNTTTGASCTAAANVFAGIVSANQVTFNGVPVNPPTTGGFARVYRITNVRANVSALGGGGLAGTTQLLASVSISGSTSLPVDNPVQIAGFIQAGLLTSIRNTANSGTTGTASLAQCGGGGPNPLNVVRFTEGFASSFKTRNIGTSSPGSGQSGATVQTVPGTIYNTETGLQIPGSNIGTADFGTRLKATFNNIPAGVRIYVSTTNVFNDFSAVSNPNAGNSTNSYAQLVAGETSAFAPVPSNTSITIGSTIVTTLLVEIPIVNGTGTAVWEVVNTNPSSVEGVSTPIPGTSGVTNSQTFDFGVWQSFTANPGANSPPVGTGSVNLSFAPTPPAFSASAGAAASGTLSIPRFADTSSSNNILAITLCQTVLLYPFVTNQAGFDTGLAIANTTTDPFGTRTQSGSCTLNFYGASAPPAVNTGNIATGTVYVTLASTAASGFQGYMIAVCNFQLAHGFAFVSDIGARNLAMGYLALILPDGTGSRNNRTEQLNN